VLVLSDVLCIFLSSVVVLLSENGRFRVAPPLHSVSEINLSTGVLAVCL
jgi:hypothetical protein